MTFTRRRAVAALGTAAFAGCLGLEPDEDRPEGVDLGLAVDPLLTGLDTPWDLTFSGEDEAFVSERPGRISRVDLGNGERETVLESDATERGEGGLLGLALGPGDLDDRLYAYYTTQGDNRVVRYDLDGSTEPEAETIVEGIPSARIHNGGRIAFGPEADLWILAGDANDTDLAQNPDSMAGSVLRVTPDGEPSDANPGFDEPRCYTIGHRNPQGIDWLSDDTPVIAEYGPTARDEISRLTAGGNYGWPAARDGDEYSDSDYDRPLVNTGTEETWAPSGISIYENGNGDGDANSESSGRLLVGGLRSQQVIVIDLFEGDEELPEEGTRYEDRWMDDGYTAVSRRTLQDELGRIRHVGQAPDGDLYAITSNRDGRAGGQFPRDEDDVLVRLTTE